VSLGRRAQDPRNLYPAIASAAQVAAELGQSDEADRLLDELLVEGGPEPYPGYLVPLSLAARILGRADDVLARLAGAGPSPWRDATAALLRGDHGEAALLFAKIGVAPEEAQARLAAAEAFAAAGRQHEVDAELAGCLPFFARVDATAYTRRGEALRVGPTRVPN